MITSNAINLFCNQIENLFHPIKIILFGSYASGCATEDSDVDILVVMPFKGHSAFKAVEILTKIDPKFPIDLLVRTPEQIKDRVAKNDFFIREIIEKGKVLYEAADKGMGAKGGGRLRKRAS